MEMNMPTFHVSDFGAVANDGIDDRVAIQAALDAAQAAGGGTVILGEGQYDLSDHPGIASFGCLRITSNITLQGAGMAANGGGTVLRLMDGSSGNITGIVRTPVQQVTENVTITGFTIDGNRANTTGKVDAFFCGVLPGDPRHCSNITVDGVEAMNCSGYGFDPHEQTFNLVIKNSISHGHGLDGFVADYITGGVFENNLAYNNDRHGFNIVTQTSNFQMIDNVAHNNGANGVVVQRGTDNVPWPNNITIQGGLFYDNARDGIFVRMADNVTVKWVDVYGNGRNGVLLSGATDSHVTESAIYNNSKSVTTGHYDGIKIQMEDDTDGSSGLTYASTGNLIDHNLIYHDAAFNSRYGVREMPDSSRQNQVLSNNIFGMAWGAVILTHPTSATAGFDSNTTTVTGPVVTGGMQNDTLLGTTGNDLMYGGDGNDKMTGGNGNDILVGGTGADAMIGGAGNDTYYVDNIGDIVTEKSSSGTDTIYSSINFTMNSNMENLIMLDGALEGNGSSNANTIVGNAANNRILGGGGNDQLYGMGGNDYLSGGDGNDLLDGGDGNDDLRGGNGNDTIKGGAGVDNMYGNSGADIFVFTALTDSGKTVWEARDVLRDFSQAQADKIDLSVVAQEAGGFSFIGNGNFANNGNGQVNYKFVGSHTIVGIDADGNGAADMEVAVIGHVALTDSDFMFG
jgi:Ca2+-binding RTX toxin-like protein